MTERVNVLLLITELNVGGAERLLGQIAPRLSRQRYRVSVACLYGAGPVADDLRAAGVPVIDLGMRGKWDLRVIGRLLRLLREERVHILHAHLIHANLLGALVGRLARVPVVVATRHNVDIGGAWREWANRWLRGWRDAVVAVSDQVRWVEIERSGIDPARVILIRNGVPIEPFASPDPTATDRLRRKWKIPPTSPVIGTLARFDEQKGHVVLLEAMARVLQRRPRARALLVGEGPLRQAVEQKAHALGLSHAVVLTGLRRDVPQVLALLDLFVLPSLWEGLPVSVLEAMAAGRPVVATRVGGVPEAVEHGVTGLLVPPRDPRALAAAIIRLLEDAELRRSMGRAGRERVEQQFSIAATVRRTEALYERLLRQNGIGGDHDVWS